MKLNQKQIRRSLECARGIADWLCMVQAPFSDDFPPAGQFPWMVYPDGRQAPANNWNYAFAIMGLLHAAKIFKEPRYEQAALAMGEFLKALQIFDPFKPKHYGAIREITPFTRWCYTRDALSAAWSFIELYRYSGDKEYLERARLWGEWFLKYGRDKEGWPHWGIVFEPLFEAGKPQICNNIQGSFQGGSLNFLYHMQFATGKSKWGSEPLQSIADHFIKYIQQPSGFFCSIERRTHKPPIKDPQNNLHRANDDLGTLGLLCTYKLTDNRKYIEAIEKFLTAVFTGQQEDGRFEETVACIPVILNVLYEAEGLLDFKAPAGSLNKALEALFAAQSDGRFNPLMRGGILENGAPHRETVFGRQSYVCARSSCYALIVLLKIATGQRRYLTTKTDFSD